MKFPKKSENNNDVGIQDYYEVNLKKIWKGTRKEGPAFLWLCVYLFFEYIRPQSLYPEIDFLPWAQIALLMTILSAFLDKSVCWVRSNATVVLSLLFFTAFLSSIFAFRPSVSFDKIEIIVGWLILYFLIITIVNTKKRFIVFLLLFFLLNFKMSQFGFRSFVTNGYTSWGVSGSPGWFKDSGDLGIEMTIFVALLVGFVGGLQQHWGLYKKYFFYFVVLTGLVTILATTSRGAQLGILAAAIWFLMIKRQLKVLLILLVVAVMVYSILPQRMIAEFEDAGEDSTSVTRLALWEYGYDVLKDHPVLGVGYENWVPYCWYMNPNGVVSGNCLVAHNTYVTAMAEVGSVGLAAYLLLIFYVFKKNLSTRVIARGKDDEFILSVSYGLDAGLVAYVVATIFFTVLWYPMIYVHLAMTVVLFEIAKKESPQPVASIYNKNHK